MWFDLRTETLAFVDRAPLRWVAEAEVAAPRAAVFAAVVTPESWKDWFPNVQDAAYTSPPPYGVGTIRDAHVSGTRWIEEVIAWADGTRFAWTVTGASVPFAAAQVESFEFADADNATRVRWTLALEPRLLARLGAPLAPRVIGRLFRRAMENLETYLTPRPR
jgi:carbon monoxide dehydrogenase subunit G